MENIMKAGVIGLGLATLLIPAAAWADVVILNNGDRIEGEVISETADEVSLRRHSGKIQYAQNIRRSTVARIEKSDVDSAAAAEPGTAGAAARPESEPRASGQFIADKPAFLKVAIAKWQAGKAVAAGSDLTRLINSSTPEELEKLSADVKNEMSISLAEFAAEAHWTAATELGEKRPVRLVMATKYEAAALAPKVVAAYEQAIKEEVRGKPTLPAKAKLKSTSKPAAGAEAQPATQAAPPENTEPTSARTIAQWLDNPNEFQAGKADATAMRVQLEYATSLLNERMRLDPEVAGDKNLRMSLTGQRTRLAALLKSANAQIAVGVAGEKNAREEAKKQTEAQRRQQRQQELEQQRKREEEIRNRQVDQALKQGAVPLQQGQQPPPPPLLPGNNPGNPNGQPNANNVNPPPPPPQQQK
jgi:hypothetical protein